jgi:hypothetical protein
MDRACSTHAREEERIHDFSGKTRRKGHLGKPRCRREDKIRMDLRETRRWYELVMFG